MIKKKCSHCGYKFDPISHYCPNCFTPKTYQSDKRKGFYIRMMRIMIEFHKRVWWVKSTENWNKTTWVNVLMLRHVGQKLKLDSE